MVVVLLRVEAVQQRSRSAYFAAHLLSMVLGEIRLLQGLQNTETMLRTTEARAGGVQWRSMGSKS